MRCRHGVVGGCIACDHEERQRHNAVAAAPLLLELGAVVRELGERAGIDVSALTTYLEKLKAAGLRQ